MSTIPTQPPAPHSPERTPKMARTIVAVATYNEKENIEKLLDAIFQAVDGIPAVDVLVVDDNSPDGTGRLVDAYAQKNPGSNRTIDLGNWGSARPYWKPSGMPRNINMTTSFSLMPTSAILPTKFPN